MQEESGPTVAGPEWSECTGWEGQDALGQCNASGNLLPRRAPVACLLCRAEIFGRPPLSRRVRSLPWLGSAAKSQHCQLPTMGSSDKSRLMLAEGRLFANTAQEH